MQSKPYLGLCIADLDKLNGCLKKFVGELVLERSTVSIYSVDRCNGVFLNLKELKGLPLN